MYVHVCFCIPSTCLSREVVLGIVYLSIFLYNLYVQDVKMRVYFQFSMYGIKRNFAANEQTTRVVDVYMYSIFPEAELIGPCCVLYRVFFILTSTPRRCILWEPGASSVDILFFCLISQWLCVMLNVSRCSKSVIVLCFCAFMDYMCVFYRYLRMTSTLSVRIRVAMFAHYIRSLP